MSLPSTGELNFLAIRTELGKSGAIDLNNSFVRGLAGKASGAISFSDLRGKSNFSTSPTMFAYPNKAGSNLLGTFSNVESFSAGITFSGSSTGVFSGDTSGGTTYPSATLKLLDSVSNTVLSSMKIYYFHSSNGTQQWALDTFGTKYNYPCTLNVSLGQYSGSFKLVLDLVSGKGTSWTFHILGGNTTGSFTKKLY